MFIFLQVCTCWCNVAIFVQSCQVYPLVFSLKCCTKESDGNHSKRENDPSRLLPILHEGKDDVFNFISKLPKTWHDPSASTVTISFATVKWLVFSMKLYELYHLMNLLIGSLNHGFCDWILPRARRRPFGRQVVSETLRHDSVEWKLFGC